MGWGGITGSGPAGTRARDRARARDRVGGEGRGAAGPLAQGPSRHDPDASFGWQIQYKTMAASVSTASWIPYLKGASGSGATGTDSDVRAAERGSDRRGSDADAKHCRRRSSRAGGAFRRARPGPLRSARGMGRPRPGPSRRLNSGRDLLPSRFKFPAPARRPASRKPFLSAARNDLAVMAPEPLRLSAAASVPPGRAPAQVS